MSVSTLMLRAVVHACQNRGVDRSDLLGDVALEASMAESHARIEAVAFEMVCQRALTLTKEPALGLCMGSELPEQALQLVGYLVRSATSLRVAHRDLERYGSLLAAMPMWELREVEDEARFEFRCPTPHPKTERMAHEWIAALAHRCISAFAPTPLLYPSRVEFMHPPPAHRPRYASVFGCDVHFNRQTNAVVYPRVLLDFEQPLGDAAVLSTLRDAADRMLEQAEVGTRYVDRVRVLLRKDPEIVRLGAAEIARRLCASESTLRRALAQEGASPSGLLDEVRCEAACSALLNAARPVKHIADSLGYADTRSFHRAFKRWMGITPVAYRKQQSTARGIRAA